MKNIRLLIPCILAAIFAACSAPTAIVPQPAASPVPVVAAPPPTAEWLSHAQLIKTKNRKIYYEGTAQGAYTADHKEWHGTITGRVYVLQADGSGISSSIDLKGVLTIHEDGRIEMIGPQTTRIHADDQPQGAGGNR